jgi:hypothetical protein
MIVVSMASPARRELAAPHVGGDAWPAANRQQLHRAAHRHWRQVHGRGADSAFAALQALALPEGALATLSWRAHTRALGNGFGRQCQ